MDFAGHHDRKRRPHGWTAIGFALGDVEQAGPQDIPILKRAEMPLLNTPRDEGGEALYGWYRGWHGSFNADAPKPKQTWLPPWRRLRTFIP
jgi:hypothetical protein